MSAAEDYESEYEFHSLQSFSGEPSDSETTPRPAPANAKPPLLWPKNYENGRTFSPPNSNTDYVRYRVFVPGGQSKMIPGGSKFLVQDKEQKPFPMDGQFSMYLKAEDEAGKRDESGKRVPSNKIPSENTELWVIFFIKKTPPHETEWKVQWRRV